MSHVNDGDGHRLALLESQVKYLGTQAAVQRFGLNSEPFLPSWLRFNRDIDREEEIRRERAYIMPRVEEYRNNLTVLSQKYNLYFAGYGEDIFVYRPSGPTQSLSKEPIMILKSPQSTQGQSSCASIHGVMNGWNHSITHVIIGNLGNEEILLCACHDGDVYAYYTSAIQGSLCLSMASPHTFFAANVQVSAWGLAVHEQSRLIAVSSNLHEITVFAFGLNSPFEVDPYVNLSNQAVNISSIRNLSRTDIPKDRSGRVLREQTFNFSMSLKPTGDNVPSIAFVDDTDGEAMSIVATDIKGNIWFLKLWEEKTLCRNSPRARKRGWGILTLPSSMFKPTSTYFETFGSGVLRLYLESVSSHEQECLLDITGGMIDVADGHQAPSATESRTVTGQPVDAEQMVRQVLTTASTHNIGVVEFHNSVRSFVGSTVILHTDRHNVRLLSGLSTSSTICRNVIRLDTVTGELAFPGHEWDHNRLNMLAAIPALSLVVVASQIGRVALLSITRHVLESREVTDTVSFRVDRTLPLLKRDENSRPVILGGGLLGMAVGPMQGDLLRAKRRPDRWLSMKYRLMLHYYDHSVTSFQIWRDFETQELQVEVAV